MLNFRYVYVLAGPALQEPELTALVPTLKYYSGTTYIQQHLS